MKKNILILIVLIFIPSFVSSCRGDKSSKPAILPIQNMVEQTSYGPQSKQARTPVEGTIAEGEANIDPRFTKGIEINSPIPSSINSEKIIWVSNFPVTLTEPMLKTGQEKYNIYCSGCHGYAGNNDGLVIEASKGTIRPANIHDNEKIKSPVGRIFYAVTNGVNNWNMPGFSEQMNTEDRWAVVAYVRALQFSQMAKANDVPKNAEQLK